LYKILLTHVEFLYFSNILGKCVMARQVSGNHPHAGFNQTSYMTML